MPQGTSKNDTETALFAGPGAMRALCRAFDWRRTPLGAVTSWSGSLQTSAATVLGVGSPMILLWGPELVQIYNDGYVPFLATKHPGGLGQPTRECWPEVWHLTAPIYARVLAGETVTLEEARLPLLRQGASGPVEELYITLSFSPVPDGLGRVGGVLVTLFDATAHVLDRAAQVERDALSEQLHGALLGSGLVLDQVSDAYLLMDDDFRIVTVNPSAERLLGRTRGDLVGRTHWDAFPASLGAEPERRYRRVVAERVETHFVHHYVGEGIDAHLEVDAYPAAGGGVALFWRDVSERMRLQAEIEAARTDAEARAATLAAVIESIPDALLVLRRDAVIIANAAALKEFGVSSVEALGNGATGAIAPLYTLLLDRTTGEPVPFEVTPIGQAFAGLRSHGQFLLDSNRAGTDGVPAGRRPIRAAAAPILGGESEITGVVTVLTDLTAVERASSERDRLLAELDAERLLLRTVLAQLPVAVFVVESPSGRVLTLNEGVTRIWGEPRPLTNGIHEYSREWVGYHTDGRRVASEEWPAARAVRGETVAEWIGQIERPDGTRVRIEVGAAPIRNAAGDIVAAVAVATDVTAREHAVRERERLLRELEVERARLAYVFERAPAFLAVVREPTHIFQFVNAAYYDLVGRRDLIGRSVADALPEAQGQDFISLLDQVLATGELFVGREVLVNLMREPGSAAEARFVDFVYMPIVESDGTRSGVIAHGTDVTAQVEARREIERLLVESEQALLDAEVARAEAEASRSEAQAANRIKGEFLAVMSHELRTPLNAIGGYVELIEMGIRGPVTELQRSDLARIQRSQRHLLGLINAVLSYAKVDAGVVHYEAADVPLDEVLGACEALIRPQADARQIHLALEVSDEQYVVRADREKLKQVVVNLLSNAVKFTEPGGHVSISCARGLAEEGAAGRVLLRVSDTGHGIASDELERVFQPFVQLDAKLTRRHEGTGLGLAISRDLARGMGGELTVESVVGAGSTFTLALPTA